MNEATTLTDQLDLMSGLGIDVEKGGFETTPGLGTEWQWLNKDADRLSPSRIDAATLALDMLAMQHFVETMTRDEFVAAIWPSSDDLHSAITAALLAEKGT